MLAAGLALCACGDETSAPGGDAGAGGGTELSPPEAGPPPWPCDAGELEQADGSCLPAGVPPGQCGQGFQSDGNGGCEALLPAEPCAAGLMALPGETTCRPVAPCGAGPWGDIPTDGATQFVDGSYGGGSSDGSETMPWTSIQAGVDAAAPGAIVAVAAGSYAEAVVIDTAPVRLWGKCPAEIEIVPSALDDAAVWVGPAGDGTELRDLAVTGPTAGVRIDGANAVLLDRLWIHQTDGVGIDIRPDSVSAEVTVSASLVELAQAAGVAVEGSSLLLEHSIVRDTRPQQDNFGRGVDAFMTSANGLRADLEIAHSLVERNHEIGVRAFASDATITDSLIRDTAPNVEGAYGGTGLAVATDPVSKERGTVDVRGTVIDGSHEHGLFLHHADATVDAVHIHHVSPSPASDMSCGLCVVPDELIGEPVPVLDVRSSVVEQTGTMGIAAVAANVSLAATTVRDIAGSVGGVNGVGIHLEAYSPTWGQPAEALVRGCRVERATTAGIGVLSSDAVIEATIVRDTRAQPHNGRGGRGMEIAADGDLRRPATAELHASLVEGNWEAGVIGFGSELLVDSSIIRDTASRELDGTLGRGVVLQHSDSLTATATLRWSIISDNAESGIMFHGAQGTVEHTIVRRSVGLPSGQFGDGVLAAALLTADGWQPASVAVDRSIVEDCARAGISGFAADVVLAGAWLDCNFIQLNHEPDPNVPSLFTDQGGNRCGCGAEQGACYVTSAQLSPPVPMD